MQKNIIHKTISLTLSALFILQPLTAQGIKVDERVKHQHQTYLEQAPNGVDVVNITTANSSGVSHNVFTEYNVPKSGVILNNANQEVNTELAGYIYGNKNLSNGGEASLILNEVSGTNRSLLNGFTEVAGSSADVIVANPNGITVNGAGFINIPKVTLTTGEVGFDGAKPHYDVNHGDVLLEGNGLNGENSNVEIYTKALKLNAKLHAKDLDVITGVNSISSNGDVTAKSSATTTGFSIDSSALGGIYAGAIKLRGTESGVGVNLPIEIVAQDSLSISADGKIVLDTAKVKDSAVINSISSSVKIDSGIHAHSLNINAKEELILLGNSAAQTDVKISAKSLVNNGLLAAGVDESFNESDTGSLAIDIDDSIKNSGVLFGKDRVSIESDTLENKKDAKIITQALNIKSKNSVKNLGEIRAGLTDIKTKELLNSGLIHAKDDLTIKAEDLNNSNGVIEGLADVELKVSDELLNNKGKIFAKENLSISAENMESKRGEIISVKESTIEVTNLLNVDDAYVEADGLKIKAKNISANNAEVLSHSGLKVDATDMMANGSTIKALGNAELNITKTLSHSNNALLYATGDINITSQTFNHSNNATIEGMANINLDVKNLDNQNGTIQANEILKINSSENIDNTQGTLYGKTETSIKAKVLDNEDGFIGSLKKVFLDLFGLTGDNSNISADGITIKTDTIQGNNSTIESISHLDVKATGDIELSSSALTSNDINITSGQSVTLRETNVIANNDLAVKSKNLHIEDKSTLYAVDNLALEVEKELNLLEGSRVISNHDLSIESETFNLSNSSIYAKDKGSIKSQTLNNNYGVVSASQMEINSTSFNNNDSNFSAVRGDVTINTTSLNNNHGLISANENLTLNTQALDNRYGNLEAAKELNVKSTNLQIKSSRFFAGEHLNVTSNISHIDKETKFLALNAMDLNFTGALSNEGEIVSNGRANIGVNGDLNNESNITSQNTLNITANNLTNNANNTGASIKGGGSSILNLTGTLVNHGFITSSGDLNITATDVLNYAGIATAYMLNINATNLYNHNTFFSGKDMKLYVSNLLKNYEDAKIYSGENLIIAKDATGAKSNKIENIVGSIESASDMNISTKVLENIGRTDIKYERVYRDILDNRTSSVVDDLKTIDISFDSGRYHNRTEANDVFALNVHNMLTDIGIGSISEDDLKNGNNFTFLAIEGDVKNLSITKSANIVSGKNLELHADDVLNKDALLSASKNINLNISNNLRNETTRENVTVQNYQYGFVKAFDHDRGWYRRHRVDEDKYYTTSNEYTPLDRSVTVTGSSLISANSITGTVGGNLINKSDISAENVEGGSIEAIIDAQHISTATEETRAELSEVTEVDSTVKESTDTSVKVPKDLEEEPLAETPQVYDPSKNNISLPNNAYGIFVTNPTPIGPLIESNPAYVNYNNFISSDYMLSRLGYDGTAQTRRLGDALYETQLVRDAIMSLTGQRFIGNAKDDKEQYTNLMNAGVNYAQEVGLTLGVAPTAKQLESLTEDLVWMEKKTVEGQEVLVPVVYLAKEYTAVKGATISANSIDLTVDGHVGNSGTIKTKEGMTLRAGTVSNVKGNIEAGKTMDISTIGDIKNLSGTIKGRTVKLRSLEGNIKNQTLSEQKELKHRLGTESYTAVDTKATITSTKGLLSLDAKKSIENIGADLNSKGDIKLRAEDVTVKTIKDKKEYAFNFGKDYVKGESVKHIQSGIKAEGLVDINGKNSINLEAANVEAKSTLLESDGKVNITAVVDSNYDESHAEANDAVEDSSVTDISLKQNVKGTNINTGTLTIKGKEGVSLESANIVATQSANIGSENGDVEFIAKSYTNAEHHESSNSSLGGLVSSKTVDSKSETLLANSSTKAQNSITIAGENVSLTATDLTTTDGNIKLTAEDKVSISAGVESKTEMHLRESSGIGKGGNAYASETHRDGSITQTAKASNIRAGEGDDSKTNHGSVVIKAGSAELIGSNIDALDNIDIKTDVGGIDIKAIALENTSSKYDQEIAIGMGDALKSLADPMSLINVKDGSLKVKVGEATYDEVDTKTKNTNHQASNLNAGGSVTLDSEEAILIKGSNISAKANVVLKAVEDVIVKEATDVSETKTKETHAKAEVSVAVSNEYAKLALAVKAVDDSRKAVQSAKKALKKYKKKFKELEEKYKNNLISKEDYEDAKDEKKYYQANVALAVTQLATATTALETQTTATATAASESFGTGTSVGLVIDVEGSQTKSTNRSTTSIASNISGNNIIIDAGEDATIQGSELNADGIEIDAKDVNIVASRDTSTSNSTNKHIEASLSIGSAGVSGSLSGGMSQTRGRDATYNNSHLNANNMVINARGNAKIEGAVLNASEELALNVEGDLHMASLRDRTKSKTVGASASVGFGGAEVNSAGLNANLTKANKNAVKEQTALNAGTLKVTVGGHSELKGVKLDSKNKEESSFSTGTLHVENIKNEADYTSMSGGISYSKSKDKNGKETSSITPTVGMPTQADKSSTTHTAIGENIKITITDKKNQTQDLKEISRDTQSAHYEMTDINTEVLDIRKNLSSEVSERGFKAVGDYAMSQAQGNQDEAWEDGGVKKTLAHAAMGAVVATIGNGDTLSGAMGAGAREAASNLTEGKDDATQQWVSGVVGAVASGGDLTGASVAIDGEKFNRQMHQREIKWIEDNAEAFARELNGGKTPTDDELHDAKSRLAQQGLRGVDKAWSMTLGSETDVIAEEFLKNNDAKLFEVDKNSNEFKYGHTNGETRIADLNEKDYNNLKEFYQMTIHATSTNPEGARDLIVEDRKDSEQSLDQFVKGISNIKLDGKSVEEAQSRFFQSIPKIPENTKEMIEGSGIYLENTLPTKTAERMDDLYSVAGGNGDAGSKVQASIATGDVIGTASMVTGVGSLSTHSGKVVVKSAKNIKKNLDNPLGDLDDLGKSPSGMGEAGIALRTNNLAMDELRELNINGTSAIRIIKGTNGKVAIIGGGMAGKGGVFDYSNALRNRGFETHLFAGNEITQASRQQFKDLGSKYGQENIFEPDGRTLNLGNDDFNGFVANHRFLGTIPLHENRAWANKVKDEGYTIVDIGDPFNKGFSIFYATEKKTIFGENYGNQNIRSVNTNNNPNILTDKPSIFNNKVTLYHATDMDTAKIIMENGQDLTYSRNNLDFGKAIYTTENLFQAKEWAEKTGYNRDSSGLGAILEYKVSNNELDKLNSKNFSMNLNDYSDNIVSPGSELDNMFREQRTSYHIESVDGKVIETSQRKDFNDHNYDIVSGPMLRANAETVKDPSPLKVVINKDSTLGQQTTFNTQKSVDILNNSDIDIITIETYKYNEHLIGDELNLMYEKAPKAKREIDTLADEVALKYGGQVAKAPIKSKERAMEKIMSNFYGNPNKIKDLARNTIVVSPDKIDKVITELSEYGASVRVIDGEKNPMGYSGVNSVIETQSGIHGEIQVNTPAMIYAKEPETKSRQLLGNKLYNEIDNKVEISGGQGHKLYEEWRALPRDDMRRKLLEQESKDYYDVIRESTNDN